VEDTGLRSEGLASLNEGSRIPSSACRARNFVRLHDLQGSSDHEMVPQGQDGGGREGGREPQWRMLPLPPPFIRHDPTHPPLTCFCTYCRALLQRHGFGCGREMWRRG